MKLPIIGGDYQNFSDQNNAQKTINWYPEPDPTGKGKLILQPTPGAEYKTQPSGGAGQIRSLLAIGDWLFTQVDGVFYSHTLRTVSGSWTNHGSTQTGSSNFTMVGDDSYVFIALGQGHIFDRDNTHLFELSDFASGSNTSTSANKLIDSGATFTTDGIAANSVVYNTSDGTEARLVSIDSDTQLTLDSDIFTTTSKAYKVGFDIVPDLIPNIGGEPELMDGYFMIHTSSSPSFYISNYQDPLKWDPLDFGTMGNNANEIQRLKRLGNYLWVIGNIDSEVWYNSGNADFPFERVPNASISYGTTTPLSVVNLADTLIWLAVDNTGTFFVQTDGLSVRKLPDPPMHNRLNDSNYYNNDAEAYGMTWKGHPWYVVTFPTEDETWVYDLSTQAWFQWSTGASGGRHLSNCYSYLARGKTGSTVGGLHVIGHSSNGELYTLEDDVYQDDGTSIVRTRQSAPLNSEHRTLFMKSIEVVVDSGASTAGTQQLLVKWSKDGGDTFGSTYTIDATDDQPTIYVPDAGRSFVFNIATSSDYGPTLIDAYANVKVGREEN